MPGSAAAAQRTPAQCRAAYAPFLVAPDYGGPGPLAVARLPRREHTCASCFPACVNASCTMRLEVLYPKGGADLGLAALPAGRNLGGLPARQRGVSLVGGAAGQLGVGAGYTVLLYDRTESVAALLDDAACVRLLLGLIDWAEADPLMRRLADTGAGVYMVGHSRGGKLAALAGAEDPRVAALCLIDPVDNTVYAPLGARQPYPTACGAQQPLALPQPLAAGGGLDALQAAQLAALQQRQGLRGQASLAQAALAAATVARQSLPEEGEAGTAGAAEAGLGAAIVGPSGGGFAVEPLEGWRGPGQADGVGGGDQRLLSSASALPSARETLSLPPPAAAASSPLGPTADRRGPPPPQPAGADAADARDTPSAPATPPSPASSRPRPLRPAGRPVVAQEALRLGLERLVTRLRYSSGLELEARFKGFDGEEQADAGEARRAAAAGERL
ncbi:hypothetical protein GPECTOR_19g223 [Gonium pectorale]|uniref:Uncharacterized protein n=1 Tax=Gonium pectorale TaxID=33097 RepID=A0A150GIZ3_GONPE|nr:hypothetical protein GPECTOR_19g223 [Gonium pectorale]|eukprot:KXZ49772.1 hypothetical protein GPECTOR_19g223 [Gonium pectorale]